MKDKVDKQIEILLIAQKEASAMGNFQAVWQISEMIYKYITLNC